MVCFIAMPYADPAKQRAYLAAHYKNNTSAYRRSTEAARRRKRAKLEALKQRPCADCDGTYSPRVMVFHHLDSSTKEMNVATAMHYYSWKRIEAEIAKCVLLCANCHALRHVNDGPCLRSGDELRRLKLKALKQSPCSDCGNAYHPNIMHFHHLDPSAKAMNVSRAARSRPWAFVKNEIDKCVLLCANCHCLRHASE